MFTSNRVHFARHVTRMAAVAASVLAVLATPASAGTTQVSGSAVFNTQCQPPVGSPPGDLGDYPPIELSGPLVGCWYTYVSAWQFNPSGTYVEQGTEIFVGCFNGSCGTFETTYTFTAKYVDDTFAQEIHGRCHHPIVGGTEGLRGRERRAQLQGRCHQPQVRLPGPHRASSDLLASTREPGAMKPTLKAISRLTLAIAIPSIALVASQVRFMRAGAPAPAYPRMPQV